MNCPFCAHNESKVIDSREAGEGIRRRRECLMCSLRFTTYERLQMVALQVAKRDSRREQFNRDKLTGSLQKACAKRPLPTGTVEKIVEENSSFSPKKPIELGKTIELEPSKSLSIKEYDEFILIGKLKSPVSKVSFCYLKNSSEVEIRALGIGGVVCKCKSKDNCNDQLYK